MSTPSGRPARPASVFDYAPKHVREQWSRDQANDAAAAEFADDPEGIPEDDPAVSEASGDEERRSSPLVPKGPHEEPEDQPGEPEDNLARGWNDEDAEDERNETEDGRREEWLDELEHRAEMRDRRAQAAEIDRAYEEKLDRLAESLRTLRGEEESSEPEQRPVSEARSAPELRAPQAVDRDIYIDGTPLPRFLRSAYVAQPPLRERGSSHLGAILSVTIAGLVAAPFVYYFAAGNPFAPAALGPRARAKAQYTSASTFAALPPRNRPEAVNGAQAASAMTRGAAAAASQARPPQGPAVRVPDLQAEATASLQSARPVPLTHVVRWPDQAQDSGAATQPPRAASADARSATARPSTAPFPAPNAPASALAFAAPSAPVAAPSAGRGAGRHRSACPRRMRTRSVAVEAGTGFRRRRRSATARVVLRRSAEAGAGAAAFALAQTYDPKVLAKMRARGVAADAAEARRWYETAQKLGSSEATQQLERLARGE